MTDLNKMLISNEIKISIKKSSKKQIHDFKPLPAILAPWPIGKLFLVGWMLEKIVFL